MRIALETGIAEFLFKNITQDNIQQLEQIVSRHQAIGINNLSVEDKMIFHNKIYEIAKNAFILEFNQLLHPVFVFCKMRRVTISLTLLTFLLIFFLNACKEKKESIEKSVLWEQRTGKYNNYRIPSLIVTQKGTLLAFC